MNKTILPALAASMIMSVLTACESGGTPTTPNAGTVNPIAAAAPNAGPFDTCASSDPEHFCLALKYVAYTDASSHSVISESDAINNIKKISAEFAQCNIGFQLEEYAAVDPTERGLIFNTANQNDLDPIRTAYSNDHTLLVVTTGSWNRSGTLGYTGANAWTNMPGDNLYGAVLESDVGHFPLIIAHELGHYLNLDHVSDQSDLMNPVIYDTSTQLYASQCASAREAISNYWQNMRR